MKTEDGGRDDGAFNYYRCSTARQPDRIFTCELSGRQPSSAPGGRALVASRSITSIGLITSAPFWLSRDGSAFLNTVRREPAASSVGAAGAGIQTFRFKGEQGGFVNDEVMYFHPSAVNSSAI